MRLRWPIKTRCLTDSLSRYDKRQPTVVIANPVIQMPSGSFQGRRYYTTAIQLTPGLLTPNLHKIWCRYTIVHTTIRRSDSRKIRQSPLNITSSLIKIFQRFCELPLPFVQLFPENIQVGAHVTLLSMEYPIRLQLFCVGWLSQIQPRVEVTCVDWRLKISKLFQKRDLTPF
jgi:hypothetical protein